MNDYKIDNEVSKLPSKRQYSYAVYEVDDRKFYEWHYLDDSGKEVEYGGSIEIDVVGLSPEEAYKKVSEAIRLKYE